MGSSGAPKDDTTDAPQDTAGGLAAPIEPQQQQQQQFPGPAQTISQPTQFGQTLPKGATKDGAPVGPQAPLSAALQQAPGQLGSEHQPIITDQGPYEVRPLDLVTKQQQEVLPSPRHELELIPEDSTISTPLQADVAIASPRILSRASAASTPDIGSSGPLRLAKQRPAPHPLPSRPSTRSPTSYSVSPIDEPLSPAIIRTASGSSRLRHPTPDINARSGSYTGNIAALEATAERFSMTSSINDAIREAHNELKRSDSRRSSILAASVRSGDYATDSPVSLLPSLSVGQQSSIVGMNNAARTGGYSPGGFIMSPTHSISGRLRSGSKGSSALSRANSTRSKPETLDGEAFPNLSGSLLSAMSRNGPGNGSVRSVRSLRSVHSVQSVQSNRSGAPLSLAEIAEMEPPSGLTRAAMDEADRTVPQLTDLADDDDSILARAHQEVEPDATDIEVADTPIQQAINDWDRTQMMGEFNNSYWDNHDQPPKLQVRNSGSPAPSPVLAHAQGVQESFAEHQHANRGTPDTVDEENVFADFDGMHCDPDSVAEHFPHHAEEDGGSHSGQRLPGPPQPQRRPQADRPARPKSYFDAETGQNMLYYPAHVPAMLNLPPKLGKGVKAAEAARNVRRSQLLSQMQMPEAPRESRVWLPDPLEGEGSINFGMPHMGDDAKSTSQHSRDLGPENALEALERPQTGTASHENLSLDPSLPQNLRRPPKLGQDARESRAIMSDLPPQLRASAFFDMPNQSMPKIEVKNGSAMDTLDSILDAAASAPVNAFTDHAYAGHLGKEVYGNEKKKNRQSQLALAPEAAEGKPNKLSKSRSTLALPEAEKRRSVWSLLPGRGKSKSSVNLLSVQEADTRSRLSGSRDGSDSDADENSALSPDHDSDSDEEEFEGQPTTLLAELQMRKKQHEKRTKNPLHHGEALHSTLLQLDAVHQHAAQTRREKQINLAWAGENAEDESDDDEDIPLGLLAAKKQLGTDATDYDLAVAARELHRPLGLMERRELDDNEPLSRRRDRLQGRPVPVSMYLQASGNATQLSMMPGSGGMPVSPGVSATSPNLEDDEHQGETLGQRRRRLHAEEDGDNPLPRARRVSTAFSMELLGELGIDEKDKDADKLKENAAPVIEEEEETLGQRRRRLQAEREAREKEMGARPENDKAIITRRLNMADVLAANPVDAPGRRDPREDERRRKEDEGARYVRDQEAKLRTFRAQVPKNMSDPKAGVVTPGGYQNGRFNDNRGGLGGHRSVSTGQVGQSTNLIGAAGNYTNPHVAPNGMNPVFAQQQPFGHGSQGGLLQSHPQFQNQPQTFVSGSLLASGGFGAFGGGIGAAGGYSANQTAYGGGVGFAGGVAPMGYGMQAGGIPMMTGQQQADLVERWRQSIR